MKVIQYLQSTKGVSWVTAVILLMLISVFGAFFIRYALGQYIELQITRTLATRLLLHGLSYAYNAMYSLPSGYTTFTSSFPDSCSFKCVDCNSTIGFLGLTDYIVCNCTDEVLGGGSSSENLAGFSIPDQVKLVCDDFFFNNLELVALSTTNNIRSLGVVAVIQAHPQSPSYKVYGKNNLRVYTELPADLIDFLGSRSSLFYSFKDSVLDVKEDYFSVGRRASWNYESISLSEDYVSGLKGMLNFIFSLCSNESPSGLYNKSLIISPGNKLVKNSSTELCEYKCFKASSFDNVIDCEWQLDFCYDLNEITNSDCTNCDCSGINFLINDLCNGMECIGNTSPAFNDFTKIDIFTGIPVNNSPLEYNFTEASEVFFLPIINSPLSTFCNCSGTISDDGFYCENICDTNKNWCDNYGALCDLVTSGFGNEESCSTFSWECPPFLTKFAPLLQDCEITVACLGDNIKVRVGGQFCDTDIIETFVRNPLKDQTITVIDRPSLSVFSFILTGGISSFAAPLLVEQQFIVNIISDVLEPTDCSKTIVRLEPEDYPRSYEYRLDELEKLNDKIFNLSVEIISDTYSISVSEIGWGDLI